MEDMLARYVDGELDDAEAAELLKALRTDPRLEIELREYEDLLRTAEELPALSAPPALADRVLDAAGIGGSPSNPRRIVPGPAWLAVAAALAAGVLIGAFGRLPAGQSERTRGVDGAAQKVVVAAPLGRGDPGIQIYRAVRLVYSGSGPDVRAVSVAGSFNGWNPVTAPMIRDGDVWSLLLILPPGEYEYMFVEDGERWLTDPQAPRTREDGFGGANGVLEIRA